MKSKKLAVLFAVLIVASMLLSACRPAAPEAPEAAADAPAAEAPAAEAEEAPSAEEEAVAEAVAEMPILRVNLTSFPDMIDPQKSSFNNEISHLRQMYEGLTRLNADLEAIPGAAESWEFNEDGTAIVFTLREGLTYADGSLLNALRFEYALKRTMNPYTAGEYAYITDDVKNAVAYRGADVENLSEEELQALEDAVMVQAYDMDDTRCTSYDDPNCRVLKIELEQPAPYFAYIAGLWVAFPVKEEIIETDPDTWWLEASNHVGNGPFNLAQLELNEIGLFEPNMKYWGDKAQYKLEYHYITDSAVAFEAYKNDELDIFAFGVEDFQTIQNDEVLNEEMVMFPGTCTFGAMFHHEKEPFTDPKVREAFAYAIDRDAWVRDVLKGVGVPTLTWVPKGVPGHKEGETRWSYDPEAALQAMADSSYGSAAAMPPVTLTFADTPRNRTRYEWLSAQWSGIFGVEISLNPVEPTTYTALTKDRETAPQVYILGWCSDYPDPQNWLGTYWRTGAFGERIAFSNPTLDELMATADATMDYEERLRLEQDAQDMLIDLVPAGLIWNRAETYLVKPWVKGVTVTAQDADWPGSYQSLTISVEAH
jgi:oligopeptide transport system substrate-binding protein